MKVFEFVNRMKEMGTPLGIVGVSLLAAFLIFIILKMLGGMRRGTWRQLVRTGATLLAAVISFIVGVILSNRIIGSLDVKNLDGLIAELETRIPEAAEAVRKALSTVDTDMIEYLLLLPATLILIPMITMIIFILLNLILKIVRAILVKILKFKKAKSNSQRLGGAILAAIEAIIVVTMLLFPITGLLSLVDAAYKDAIESADTLTSYELQDTYDEYFSPFTENPVFTFVENTGAGLMSDSIATVKIGHRRTNIRDEVLSVARVIIVDSKELRGADFTALTAKEQAAVESIVDTLAESPFMSEILVSIMQTVPSVYESGLINIDTSEEIRPIVDSVMTFLEEVNSDSLGDDLNTVLDFYFGFCDSGILTAMTDGQDIMKFISDDYNGDRHILTMINTLSGNDRTKPILDSMYNLVLNAAFDRSGSDSENDALADIEIEDVRQGLNDIVAVKKDNYDTHEEYREALSTTIGSTINDTVGVELEKETIDEIADYVDENYAEKLEELTDEEFNELMFEVIDIYQGYLNGEEINPDDLENLIPPKD